MPSAPSNLVERSGALEHPDIPRVPPPPKVPTDVFPSPLPNVAMPTQAPSRVSVLPIVSTVAPTGSDVEAARRSPAKVRRSAIVGAAAALAVAIVLLGWLGMRAPSATTASAAALQPPAPAPPSAPRPTETAQSANGVPPTTNINDLPRVSAPRPVIFAPPPRPAHASEPAVAVKPAGSAAPSASSKDDAAPSAAASASTDVPDPLLDKAPAAVPSVDPLVKAVQQSIDDDKSK